ncbi:MAG: tetratricopeptide repeat protein [Planctomycetota bacterium]
MARDKQALDRNRQKKLQRRQQRERKGRGIASSIKMSSKMSERLDDAYDLIRSRHYVEAEELLKKLDSRGTSYPEVVEALVSLYQEMGDHEQCCQAAQRLASLRPRDPEAQLLYAQESMFCGRAVIALLHYQQFIESWPEHPHVTKAKHALEFLIPEAERRRKDFGFPKECGLQWLALHEESLGLLQSGKFSACIAKCRELLAHVPAFPSARNNLAIACFQSGRSAESVAVVEETRRLAPDNRFAQATLARLYFLTGRIADANQLADQIVADPPTEQDSLIAALEMLTYLGRDEEVVTLAEAATEEQVVDDVSGAAQHHFLAYAKCRLGNEKAAKPHWKKCQKLLRHFPEARENLLDLDSGAGHAPWASSFAKWIPKETMDEVIRGMGDEKHTLLTRNPAIASLVPALLDRGDPFGRELALRLAMADQSPPMLDALKTFALGSRGPDAMRSSALMFLKEQGVVDAGPHRIYARGKWTDIQLLAAEIYSAPIPSASSPQALELVVAGIEAMKTGDYRLAEVAFEEALEEEPDNCSAAYNLCAIWLRRDGNAGKRKARTRLEQLHKDSPDYPFATIALAQFAAMDGEFQTARDLLAPIFQAKRLHISEATALFTSQTQIALEEGDLAGAEQSFDLLCEFADEGDANLPVLRRRIDKASRKGGWLGLGSWFQ